MTTTNTSRPASGDERFYAAPWERHVAEGGGTSFAVFDHETGTFATAEAGGFYSAFKSLESAQEQAAQMNSRPASGTTTSPRWYVEDTGSAGPRRGRYLVRDAEGFTPGGLPSTYDHRQLADALAADLNAAAAPMRQQPEQQHQAADVATDQRVCVTCEEPIQLTPGLSTVYEHVAGRSNHRAQPKLWHPMDADPFAGLDDEDDGFVSELTAADPLLPAFEEDQNASDREAAAAECDGSNACPVSTHVEGCFVEPVFPPAEPEPSISIEQFQQRVAAGEWQTKAVVGAVFPSAVKAAVAAEEKARAKARDLTQPSPDAERSVVSSQVLAALSSSDRPVYGGTANPRKVARRRATNRVARATRRTNRGH